MNINPISRAAGALLFPPIPIITDGCLRAATYRRVLLWSAVAAARHRSRSLRYAAS